MKADHGLSSASESRAHSEKHKNANRMDKRGIKSCRAVVCRLQSGVYNREVLWLNLNLLTTKWADCEYQSGNSETRGRSCLIPGGPAPSLMTLGSRAEGVLSGIPLCCWLIYSFGLRPFLTKPSFVLHCAVWGGITRLAPSVFFF